MVKKITTTSALLIIGIVLLLVAMTTTITTTTVYAQNQTTTATTTSEAATNETTTTTAAASPARNNNMTGVQFLFIQHAQSGSVSEVNATTSTLELSDVPDKTIMFSDRPDRIVTSIDTTDFIGNWSTGPDSFAADPPNAVLILDDEDEVEQRQDIAVIELFNPEYDSEANTLKYDITAENATTTTATSSSINLPGEFGQSTLVIDDDSDSEIHGWHHAQECPGGSPPDPDSGNCPT